MESQSYNYSSSSTTYHHCSCPHGKNSKPSPPPPPPSYHSSLHSVRKLPAKPWKKPIAPLPPIPPRVYKVDHVDFKQVVQKLTAAPEFQPRRLQSVAPPPLSLSTPTPAAAAAAVSSDNNNIGNKGATLELFPSPNNITATMTPLSSFYRELMSETLDTQPWNISDSFAVVSPLGFGSSPNSHPWCSFPLLSPGTLSSLEQSTVL
ncbi:VQ motif-containing protein 29 [Camellia lanceoleosa]|uniref:VQ motif-containing protein 29 n=1 Tax=Camellia lanceoleosa TaxID=1840588 RepID=A0ACC0J6D3_9ERIC|nr:VQ motif-containing protein 29 [Camellia lanceoleosa]